MWKARDCHFIKKTLIVGDGFSCPITESKCHVIVKDVTNINECVLMDSIKVLIQEISEVAIGWATNGATKLLENLIITMKKGEVSQFDVSTYLQLTPGLIVNDFPDTETEFSIILELVDFDDSTPLCKLCDSEKYDLALSHKNEGSKLFQEENIQAAFFHYSLSTKYLISMSVNEEDNGVSDKYHKLMCICYLNLAACQLKYKNYQSVIMNCSKALNIDGRNVKALYRRATAYKELGRNKDARADLLWAKKHEPRNKVIHDLLQSLMEDNSSHGQ